MKRGVLLVLIVFSLLLVTASDSLTCDRTGLKICDRSEYCVTEYTLSCSNIAHRTIIDSIKRITNWCQCFPDETCTDGIRNQGETGIDCGGPCPACEPSCPSLPSIPSYLKMRGDDDCLHVIDYCYKGLNCWTGAAADKACQDLGKGERASSKSRATDGDKYGGTIKFPPNICTSCKWYFSSLTCTTAPPPPQCVPNEGDLCGTCNSGTINCAGNCIGAACDYSPACSPTTTSELCGTCGTRTATRTTNCCGGCSAWSWSACNDPYTPCTYSDVCDPGSGTDGCGTSCVRSIDPNCCISSDTCTNSEVCENNICTIPSKTGDPICCYTYDECIVVAATNADDTLKWPQQQHCVLHGITERPECY